MTCYERLRKKDSEERGGDFHRLNSYFHALENNKLDEYHDRREQKNKQKRLRV